MKPSPHKSARLPAKLIRPRPHGVLPRTRLFERLDGLRGHKIVWITAPAGAGKTMLLSSYLETRRLPHLWYQVDESDGDPASFFHYLGQAVLSFGASRDSPLPALTPEYLPGLSVFSQRFFESLYRRLPRKAVLVLDNYQDVADSALLHDIVRDGAALLPPGVNLVVISRAEPPPAFARLRVHGELAVIGFDDLRLSLDEARGIAQRRGADPESVERCLAESQGWTAGLVLLLEQTRPQSGEMERGSHPGQQLLFDYFAAEVFARLPAETRGVLLQTALLPKMTGPAVAALTGRAGAEGILADLHRRDFFVLRRDEPDAVFEYHPLFRAFLLAECQKTLAPEAFAALLERAARVLAGAGQDEDAVPLYLRTGDYGALAALLPKLAPALLSQGRHRTLEGWLGAIPEAFLQEHAWLLHWLGQARLPFDQPGARACLERAFHRFDRDDDATGLYLSWAGIGESYFLEWSDFSGLDPWIAAFAGLRARHPEFPAPEVELHVYAVLVSGVTHRQPQHPELPAWVEHGRALLETDIAAAHKVPLGAHLLHHCMWTGNLNQARRVVEKLDALIRSPGIPPLAFIAGLGMIAVYHWGNGNAQACWQAVEEVRQRAETSGVNTWNHLWLAQCIYGGLVSGDMEKAEAYLREVYGTVLASEGHRSLDLAHYHQLAALLAQQRGDAEAALRHSRTSLAMASRAGVPFPEALEHINSALPLFQTGWDAEAQEHLRLARQTAAAMGSNVLEYLCFLTEARVHLERGERVEGLTPLAGALRLSRECGDMVFGWWGPEAMARLYAAALEAGIEVPYVQSLIRRMGLAPPDPIEAPEAWPWALEIRTLGRFAVLREGKTLHLAGPVRQKPLELLMALVALGGSDVPWASLADALWPNAAGDTGYRTLVTTVQRLRKLLEHPEALRFAGGTLSLDPRFVRADAWSFERLAEHTAGALRSPESAALLAAGERLAALYRGPFLERIEAPWAIARRERLRARHLNLVRNLGRALENLGHESEALDLYRSGIEADPSLEAFHQYLLHALLRQGRIAEARAAYEHCRRLCAVFFGKTPPQEIENLIQPYL